jgi:hypothetical protein
VALGGSAAKVTLNDNGTIIPPLPTPTAGTYIMNADCTGTLFTGGGTNVMIVVVDGGREFYQMRIDPANIVLFGTTKLVSSGNNAGVFRQ